MPRTNNKMKERLHQRLADVVEFKVANRHWPRKNAPTVEERALAHKRYYLTRGDTLNRHPWLEAALHEIGITMEDWVSVEPRVSPVPIPSPCPPVVPRRGFARRGATVQLWQEWRVRLTAEERQKVDAALVVGYAAGAQSDGEALAVALTRIEEATLAQALAAQVQVAKRVAKDKAAQELAAEQASKQAAKDKATIQRLRDKVAASNIPTPPATPAQVPLADVLLTIEDLAAKVCTSPRQIRNMQARGQIPDPRKIPGLGLRWELKCIEQWIAQSGQ